MNIIYIYIYTNSYNDIYISFIFNKKYKNDKEIKSRPAPQPQHHANTGVIPKHRSDHSPLPEPDPLPLTLTGEYLLKFSPESTSRYDFHYELSNYKKSTRKALNDKIITICTTDEVIKKGNYQVEMKVDRYKEGDMFQAGITRRRDYKLWALSHGDGSGKYVELGRGDVVRIVVAFTEEDMGTVTFFINGEFIRNDLFRWDDDYYFAVAMRKTGNQITILSSEYNPDHAYGVEESDDEEEDDIGSGSNEQYSDIE